LVTAAGEATTRVETGAALQAIADVFWFSLEFGVLWDDGELEKVVGGFFAGVDDDTPERLGIALAV
jgi:phenylalanine-4-hydroxylase